MSKLRLSFACGPYDRTQALRDGTIQVEGVDLNYVAMQPAEIFWHMLATAGSSEPGLRWRRDPPSHSGGRPVLRICHDFRLIFRKAAIGCSAYLVRHRQSNGPRPSMVTPKKGAIT